MLLKIHSEKRAGGWHVEVQGLPGTSAGGNTFDEALAGTLDRLAERARRRELTPPIELLIVEPSPAGMPSFTGADLLALWKSLPHDDPSWADDAEKVTRSQPTTVDEPSPWER